MFVLVFISALSLLINAHQGWSRSFRLWILVSWSHLRGLSFFEQCSPCCRPGGGFLGSSSWFGLVGPEHLLYSDVLLGFCGNLWQVATFDKWAADVARPLFHVTWNGRGENGGWKGWCALDKIPCFGWNLEIMAWFLVDRWCIGQRLCHPLATATFR